MKPLLLALLLLVPYFSAEAVCASLNCDFCENHFYSSPVRATLKETIGRGIGYNHGYTTLGVFFTPSYCRCSHVRPFIDLRGHALKNHKWAFNTGVGARILCPSLCRVFGFNVYYDYRRAKKDYHQVGIGLEILGPRYDLRVNAYIPVGHKTYTSHPTHFHYPGGYIATRRREQKALRGVDGEIGTSLRRWCPCWCRCWDLYVAVGAYGFPDECGDKANGCKVRLGINFLDRFTAEVKVSDDRLFGTRVQGVFALSIPLYPCVETCCCADPCTLCLESLATQPVERQEIIVTGKERNSWTGNY